MKIKKTIPALPVQDIKQSMDFYANRLGFAVRYNDDSFCIVVRDEVEIHLWKSGDESWREKGAGAAHFFESWIFNFPMPSRSIISKFQLA